MSSRPVMLPMMLLTALLPTMVMPGAGTGAAPCGAGIARAADDDEVDLPPFRLDDEGDGDGDALGPPGGGSLDDDGGDAEADMPFAPPLTPPAGADDEPLSPPAGTDDEPLLPPAGADDETLWPPPEERPSPDRPAAVPASPASPA